MLGMVKEVKKLIIAVDCDDVIVGTTLAIIRYYNATYGTTLHPKDFYSGDLSAWGVQDDDTAITRVNAYHVTDEYRHMPPLENAVTVLKYLSAMHEVHVVTGRADSQQADTKRWLNEYFKGVFATTEFTNFVVLSEFASKTRSKADVCAQLGVEVLIEDHLHHARLVAARGIDVLLFGDYPWNVVGPTDAPLPSNIIRVKDWQAVQEWFDGRC